MEKTSSIREHSSREVGASPSEGASCPITDLVTTSLAILSHPPATPPQRLDLARAQDELALMDRSVLISHLPLLSPLLDSQVSPDYASFQKILPALYRRAGGEPMPLEVDIPPLLPLQTKEGAKQAMERSETLFTFIGDSEKERIADELSKTARLPDTREKIAFLYSLVKDPSNRQDFWNHPFFADPLLEHYVLLAHQLGLITEEELATLFTITFSLHDYRERGLPTISLPLFSEEGTPHPIMWELIGKTMGLNNIEKRQEWFDAMKLAPPLEQHFLYVEGEPSSPEATEPRRTIMNAIQNKGSVNILFRPELSLPNAKLLTNSKVLTPCQNHFVPTIHGALVALQLLAGEHLPTPKYQFGLGIPSIMRDQHKRGERVVTLQSRLCPSPKEADAYEAPAAELTLHDFLYHFYLASFIPPLDMQLFMDLSKHLETVAKKEEEPIKTILNTLVFLLIDAELSPYRTKKPAPPLRDTFFSIWQLLEQLVPIAVEKSAAVAPISFNWSVQHDLKIEVLFIAKQATREFIPRFRKAYTRRNPDGRLSDLRVRIDPEPTMGFL